MQRIRGLGHRIVLTLINFFFPPLAVAMLCGVDWDLILNCCLFLLAIIPSHVHGFYISCTYFYRRSKVKKGLFPGGSKPLIKAGNVIRGGASQAEYDRLYRKAGGLERKTSRKRSARTSASRRGNRSEMVGRTLDR